MSRPKLLCALFILLIGFALPLGFYMRERGKIVPVKMKQLIEFSKQNIVSNLQTQSEQEVKIDRNNSINVIMSLFIDVVKAIGRLIEEISDNLMYFFLPALLIGFYYRFCKQSKAMAIESFFVPVFIVFNVVILVLLHYSQGYISRRHCLPLIVFSIFYVPLGLQILAEWLSKRFSKGCLENNPKSSQWYFILVIIGITICLPKLVRPLRIEKKGYREVAKWLKENTAEEDLIAVPDFRIGFYAERDISTSENEHASQEIDYIVSIVKDKNGEPKIGRNVKEKLSLWVDERRKKDRLIIYKVL